MIIGVDVDLTIVDTLTGLIQYVKSKLPDEKSRQHLNKAIELYIQTFNDYGNFHELLDSVLKRYNVKAKAENYWRQKDLYDNLKPYEEAFEVINWFHRNGAKIVFITTAYPEHFESKMNFVLKYFPYAYDFVSLNKKYLITGIDYFIDDNIQQIEDMMYLGDPNIQCFLYRTPFNVDNPKYQTFTWLQIKQWFINSKITFKPRYFKINQTL